MSDGVRRLPDGGDERGGPHRDLVMAAAGVGWFDWDLRSDHLDFDERMCRLCGIDPATFDHRVDSFWATLYPEDRPSVEALVTEALEACGDYLAEYRVALPGGAVRWVEARGQVLAGADGRAARMLGVARDTTDQRLARDTVARALEHMADGFLSVDRSWTVTYVNRNAEVFVGPAAEARGRPLWEVWPHLATPGYEPLVRRAAATGEPDVFTKYVVAADRWFQVRVVPHPDGTSFFATDVTALRAAQLEKERSLSRPDQARAVLAYSAALAEADTLADVIDVVATMVLPAFGATGMLVSLVESNRLKLAGHSGYHPRAVALLDVLSTDDDVPIAQVLRTREPLFLPSPEAYLASFPGRATWSRPPASRPGPSSRSRCPAGPSAASRSASTTPATSRRTSGRCWSASAACSPRRWPGPGCATRSGPWPPSCSSSCCPGPCRGRPGWWRPRATSRRPTGWASAVTGTTCWSCPATGWRW